MKAALTGAAALLTVRRLIIFFNENDCESQLPDMKLKWRLFSFLMPFACALAGGRPFYVGAVSVFLLFHAYTDCYTGKLYSIVSFLYLSGYAILFYKCHKYWFFDDILTSIALCAACVLCFWLLHAINSGDFQMLLAFLPWLYLIETPQVMKIELFLVCSTTERIIFLLFVPCGILLASFISACLYGFIKKEKRTPYAPHLLWGAGCGIVVSLLL